MASRAAEDGKFYVHASTAESKLEPNLIIEKDTNSDKFVAELPNKVIIVTQKPDPNAAFHEEDEWAKWLKMLDKNGQFSLTTMGEKKEIEHFELQINNPIPLKFSSAKEALINAFGEDDAKGIDPPGYNDPLLCAGLVKPEVATKQVELGKAWEFAGLTKDMLPAPFQSLLVEMDWSLPQKHRNALWFNPGFGSQIKARLAMQLADPKTLNALFFLDKVKMEITKAEIVCKKVLTQADTGQRKLAVDEGEALFGLECKLGDLTLTGCLELSDGAILFTLQNNDEDAAAKIIEWLGDVIWKDKNKLKDMEKVFRGEPFKSISFRRFQLSLDTSEDGNPKVDFFRVDLQASTPVGQSPDSVKEGKKTLFLLSYTWNNLGVAETTNLGTIRGELWEPSDESSLADPEYEEWTDFQPIPKDTPIPEMEIAYLIPGQTIDSIPDTVPKKISRAFISLSLQEIAIGATLTANKVEAGAVPQPYLGDIKLDASFSRTEGKKEFNFELYIMAGIEPSQSSTHSDPALLTGDLIYKRSS
ncbi:hypothetical protein ASPWEDRAFT_31411 [Aspergillus wentii DTO 134E9]|uniref:Uncharacterized protein n=1 Tax=Aspergillus wentii DTO 134E9 TaxID=1073089 RepID=A0A1L9RC97_ASPWE|nr:uncharacterized protein ASPWEDRAFT_31411 [Aspergillus wentii DTO 134E9]OJJ32518.1 hypothetical protein ASPWEDRAFT_31411 [Aspergillus wentii DTO 134E9]